MCSQRLFLLKQLRDQGMSRAHLLSYLTLLCTICSLRCSLLIIAYIHCCLHAKTAYAYSRHDYELSNCIHNLHKQSYIVKCLFKFLWCVSNTLHVPDLPFITGSIARSAKLPVFNLLRGRFWGFSPRRGDTLHRWGWNLARRREPSVPSFVPNFTPIDATIRL